MHERDAADGAVGRGLVCLRSVHVIGAALSVVMAVGVAVLMRPGVRVRLLLARMAVGLLRLAAVRMLLRPTMATLLLGTVVRTAVVLRPRLLSVRRGRAGFAICLAGHLAARRDGEADGLLDRTQQGHLVAR